MSVGMDFLVFSGNANKVLAESICNKLGMRMGDASVIKFSDGEIFVKINESVRGRDVFVVQPTSGPAEIHLMELMIMADALRRASANSITAVMPYYGYARQDRTVEPRVPITSKLIANLLTTSGFDRVVTMDLHAGQIQAFFDIPVDNLYATPIITKYLKEKNFTGDDYVVLSPDAGGVARARVYAKMLNTSLAIIDKRRTGPNVAKAMHVIGEVKDKHVIIIDDMIDTAGTLTEAAGAVMTHGAKSVVAAATHGVLSGPAIERIVGSDLTEVIVTDTISLSERVGAISKITILPTSDLFAEAISRIHNKVSISTLFE